MGFQTSWIGGLRTMKPDILTKLAAELQVPITSERQVVYIMVELRKLMELNGDCRPAHFKATFPRDDSFVKLGNDSRGNIVINCAHWMHLSRWYGLCPQAELVGVWQMLCKPSARPGARKIKPASIPFPAS
jgi:hypothetical protein